MISQYYITGRNPFTAEGFTFAIASESCKIEPWMTKTRESMSFLNAPVVECHAVLKKNGTFDFVLCASRGVDYTMQNGERKKTRPYAYSHYRRLRAEDNPTMDIYSLSEAAAKLLCPQWYLDLARYEACCRNRALPLFDTIPEGDIESEYKSFVASTPNAEKEEEAIALLLSWYWDCCWSRINDKQSVSPLFLIGDRRLNREGDEEHRAILADGIRFFVDNMLPSMPEGLRRIISITIGTNYYGSNDQPNSAFRICAPVDLELAGEMESVYGYRYRLDIAPEERAFRIKLGQRIMGKESMPKAYLRVFQDNVPALLRSDFDFLYTAAQIEDAQEKGDLERAAALLKRANELLIQNHQGDEKLCRYVLFPYETWYLKKRTEQMTSYDAEELRSALESLRQAANNLSSLTQTDLDQLANAYIEAAAKQLDLLSTKSNNDQEVIVMLSLSIEMEMADNQIFADIEQKIGEVFFQSEIQRNQIPPADYLEAVAGAKGMTKEKWRKKLAEWYQSLASALQANPQHVDAFLQSLEQAKSKDLIRADELLALRNHLLPWLSDRYDDRPNQYEACMSHAEALFYMMASTDTEYKGWRQYWWKKGKDTLKQEAEQESSVNSLYQKWTDLTEKDPYVRVFRESEWQDAKADDALVKCCTAVIKKDSSLITVQGLDIMLVCRDASNLSELKAAMNTWLISSEDGCSIADRCINGALESDGSFEKLRKLFPNNIRLEKVQEIRTLFDKECTPANLESIINYFQEEVSGKARQYLVAYGKGRKESDPVMWLCSILADCTMKKDVDWSKFFQDAWDLKTPLELLGDGVALSAAAATAEILPDSLLNSFIVYLGKSSKKKLKRSDNDGMHCKGSKLSKYIFQPE